MRRPPVLAAVLPLLLASAAVAQPPQGVMPAPRISSVMPLGAKAGTTVDVTVAGTDLDDPAQLRFTHPGITAELVVPPEPMVDPKAPKPKDPPKPKAKATAAHKFKVTVPANTPLGRADVRLVTKLGVSNPRAFVVGDLPEVNETDKPHADVPDAQKVALGTTVNGTIAAPADVDYYAFPGKAGQRVLAACAATSVDSRCRPLVEVYAPGGRRLGQNRGYRNDDALADVTLPSDGEYLVRVCEFAYQSGGPDSFYRLTVTAGPWVDAVFPPVVAFGKPTAVTLYGRNLPGGKVVEGASIDGRPVEALAVTVAPPADAARDRLLSRDAVAPTQALNDGFEYRLASPLGTSNPVPLYYTDAAVYAEKGTPNDTIETAEPVPAPCDVAGRIDRRYDKDWFRFDAKKGEVFYLELFADRLGAGMDTYFVVKPATAPPGAKAAAAGDEQDDDPEVLHPLQFFNRSMDPAALKFVAPADGPFAVMVGSREANVNFGPRCAYRLRIAKPAPDFRAVVMPKSREASGATVAAQGSEVALDVFVDRRDGFNGPVTATVEGLPAGVTATPAVIGTASRWGTVVLSIADAAAEFTGPLSVKCSATVNDKPVIHPARPASITWSVQPMQNTPTVTRLDDELVFAVRAGKGAFRLALDLPQAKVKAKDKDGKEVEAPLVSPVFVKPGDKLTLPVKVAWQGGEPRANPVNLKVERIHPNNQTAAVGTQGGDGNTPAGMIPKEKADGAVTVDVRPTAPPGVYAVVVSGETAINVMKDPAQKDKKTAATATAFAQPLQVTVLPLSLGKFTVVPPANNQLKAGATGEITLKVERQFEYAGAYQVKVTVPKEAAGVTAKDVVLPAGADEVKIPVEVAKDAKDGGSYQIGLTATVTVHDKFPVVHEAKVPGLRVVPEPKDPPKKK